MTNERNKEWAVAKLREFQDALKAAQKSKGIYNRGFSDSEDVNGAFAEADRLFPVAAHLMEDLLNTGLDRTVRLRQTGVASQYIAPVDQAVGLAESAAELEANWPSEPAATLDTSAIHPWVWDPAKDLWEIGKYKEALHTASVTVNARLQAKLNRTDIEFGPWRKTPSQPRTREKAIRG